MKISEQHGQKTALEYVQSFMGMSTSITTETEAVDALIASHTRQRAIVQEYSDFRRHCQSSWWRLLLLKLIQ